MPTARSSMALVYHHGKIWAIGGYSTSHSNAVESYDPATDTWSVETSLQTPRQWPSAWLMDGTIHVGGGSSGTIVKSSEFYDTTSGTWTVSADLPDDLYGSGSIRVGEKLYLIGGKNGSGYTNKLSQLIYPHRLQISSLRTEMPRLRQIYLPLAYPSEELPSVCWVKSYWKDWACLQPCYRKRPPPGRSIQYRTTIRLSPLRKKYVSCRRACHRPLFHGCQSYRQD